MLVVTTQQLYFPFTKELRIKTTINGVSTTTSDLDENMWGNITSSYTWYYDQLLNALWEAPKSTSDELVFKGIDF